MHRQYAATDPQLTSDLVYGGPLPATDELIRNASARGVRVRSFVEYQGLLDLRGYLRRQGDRLAADRLYPPALYLPQRFRLIDGGPATAGPPGTALNGSSSRPHRPQPVLVLARTALNRSSSSRTAPNEAGADDATAGDGASDDPVGHDGADLLGQVVDWLTADSARFVLILGDFGRGKTSACTSWPARCPSCART